MTSLAYGLNNRGLIAGYSRTDAGESHATLWSTVPPDTTAPSIRLFAAPRRPGRD